MNHLHSPHMTPHSSSLPNFSPFLSHNSQPIHTEEIPRSSHNPNLLLPTDFSSHLKSKRTETSVDSPYKLSQNKSSAVLSMQTSKGLRIRQKNEKNFKELNKSLANLALKRIIGQSSLENHPIKSHLSITSAMEYQSIGAQPSFDQRFATQVIDIEKPSAFFYSPPITSKQLNFTPVAHTDYSYGSYNLKPSFLASEKCENTQKKGRNIRPNIHHVHSDSLTTIRNNQEKRGFSNEIYQGNEGRQEQIITPSGSLAILLHKDKSNGSVYTEKPPTIKKMLKFTASVQNSESKMFSQRTTPGKINKKSGDFQGLFIKPAVSYEIKEEKKRPKFGPKCNKAKLGKGKKEINEKDNGGKLKQGNISDGVEYLTGGVGSYNTARSQESEEYKESCNDLSLTVKEEDSSRIIHQPRVPENYWIEKKKLLDWKQDLKQIKYDMEKRKLSYQEVNEFVKKYEDEEIPKKQHKNPSPNKEQQKIIKNAHIVSASVEPKTRPKKVIKIFDPIPVAKRLSKEQYENSLKEFLFRDNKSSAGIKTTCDWDDQKTIHDIFEKRRTSDFPQYSKANINRYPIRGFHDDALATISDISGSATNRLKHCCGSEENCNIF